MDRYSIIFLLGNMAIAFYNTGTIWAMEVDIFRSWRLMDRTSFEEVRKSHWKKLPYWIFTPVGIAFGGSVVLIWYHPAGSPGWAIWGSLGCQLCSHVLTALFWGPWQAKLSSDPLGAQSPLLRKILRTHWVRTALINAYALIEFFWVIGVLGFTGRL
jgi:hypothetical protein